MSIVRSIAGVALGIASAAACLFVTAVALESTISPEPFGIADMWLTGFRCLLGCLLGGYATAAVARRAPLKHCAALGAIFMLTIVCLVAWGSLDFFPQIFIDSMFLLVPAAAVMGGCMRRLAAGPQIGFGQGG